MKTVIVGVIAVALTAAVALLAELITLLGRSYISSTRRLPGMSVSIDWSSVVSSVIRTRLLTPTGLTAAAVIFGLAMMLFDHRSRH